MTKLLFHQHSDLSFYSKTRNYWWCRNMFLKLFQLLHIFCSFLIDFGRQTQYLFKVSFQYYYSSTHKTAKEGDNLEPRQSFWNECTDEWKYFDENIEWNLLNIGMFPDHSLFSFAPSNRYHDHVDVVTAVAVIFNIKIVDIIIVIIVIIIVVIVIIIDICNDICCHTARCQDKV